MRVENPADSMNSVSDYAFRFALACIVSSSLPISTLAPVFYLSASQW
jgi:hypothetical protein